MTDRGWKRHVGVLVSAGIGILALGWMAGQPGLVVLTALFVYLAWHLVNVWRLHRWLKKPDHSTPVSHGIWADLFNEISWMVDQNKAQEQRHRAMIEDFQNLTDAFPDATLIINRQGNLKWFNNAARELLTLSEQRDIDRPVASHFHGSDFSRWLAVHENLESRLKMPAPGRDDVWLDIGVVPIRENQRMIVFRDVSEVHQVEQMRRDFVTNISHELRTPLTVMVGYLELLQDQPSGDMKDAIDRMHAQSVQMQSLLDDLLELSRLQADETHDEEAPVDIPAMLAQLKEQAEDISRGRHELHFEIDERRFISGIASDLESAFRNLIVNALKYTPEGGSVAVTWRDSEEGPTLRVTDTGIGIPRREIPRLTERFYRVGSDRGRGSGGTGLGLAIVKHVLNAHQAHLVIESESGVGSQFSCIFPPERKRTGPDSSQPEIRHATVTKPP